MVDPQLHCPRAAHRQTGDQARFSTRERRKAPIDLCDEVRGEGGFDLPRTAGIRVVDIPARAAEGRDGDHWRNRAVRNGIVEQLGEAAVVEPLSFIAIGTVKQEDHRPSAQASNGGIRQVGAVRDLVSQDRTGGLEVGQHLSGSQALAADQSENQRRRVPNAPHSESLFQLTQRPQCKRSTCRTEHSRAGVRTCWQPQLDCRTTSSGSISITSGAGAGLPIIDISRSTAWRLTSAAA